MQRREVDRSDAVAPPGELSPHRHADVVARHDDRYRSKRIPAFGPLDLSGQQLRGGRTERDGNDLKAHAEPVSDLRDAVTACRREALPTSPLLETESPWLPKAPASKIPAESVLRSRLD